MEYNDRNYQYGADDYRNFTLFVHRTLSLNKAPVLDTLILHLGPICHSGDIRIWTDTAVARHVCTLKIVVRQGSEPVNLLKSLYTCRTLETLMLERCLVSDVLNLPSLKILRLVDVDYASLHKLSSSCPNLKQFVYLVHKEDEGKDFIVVMLPCLRILWLNDFRYGREGGVYVVEAPCVEELAIIDETVYDSRRIENMPNLVKAHVDIDQGVTHEFLRALSSARRLYLSVSLLSEVPTPVISFDRLVHLELNTCAQGPSLETPDYWKQPRSIPASLETFAWTGYNGRRGDLEMMTTRLKNATRLKTATITPLPTDANVINDLVSVFTPSPSPRLLFN